MKYILDDVEVTLEQLQEAIENSTKEETFSDNAVVFEIVEIFNDTMYIEKNYYGTYY